MTGLTACDFLFLFSGFFSVGILLWLVLFGTVFYFKHAEHVLPKVLWEWFKENAESAM